MTLVWLVFISNCLKHLSPLLVSLLLISLVSPQIITTSFFKILSILKCEGEIIASKFSLGLVRPISDPSHCRHHQDCRSQTSLQHDCLLVWRFCASFATICLLFISLLMVINGSLRLDNRANLLEVVVIGLICQGNEFMGLEEFLVRLFVTVFHLWLKYHNHSNHSTYQASLI